MKNFLKLSLTLLLLLALIFTFACKKELTPRQQFSEAANQIFTSPINVENTTYSGKYNTNLEMTLNTGNLEDSIKLSANGLVDYDTMSEEIYMTLEFLSDTLSIDYILDKSDIYMGFPEISDKYFWISAPDDITYDYEQIIDASQTLFDDIKNAIGEAITDEDFSISEENASLDDKTVEGTKKITLHITSEKLKTIFIKIVDIIANMYGDDVATEAVKEIEGALEIPENAYLDISFYTAEERTAAFEAKLFDGEKEYTFKFLTEESVGKLYSSDEGFPEIYITSTNNGETFDWKMEIILPQIEYDEVTSIVPEKIFLNITGNNTSTDSEFKIEDGIISFGIEMMGITVSQDISFEYTVSNGNVYFAFAVKEGLMLPAAIGMTASLSTTPAGDNLTVTIPENYVSITDEEAMEEFGLKFEERYGALFEMFETFDEDIYLDDEYYYDDDFTVYE